MRALPESIYDITCLAYRADLQHSERIIDDNRNREVALGVLGESSTGALGYGNMTSDIKHGRGNADLDKKQQELLDLCAQFFGESPHVEKVHVPDRYDHRELPSPLCLDRENQLPLVCLILHSLRCPLCNVEVDVT